MSIQNYKALDIESLGKPIHIIREKIESLISSSCGNLTYEFQGWIKSHHIQVNIKQVTLYNFTSHDMEKSSTSTFQHCSGGQVFISSDKQLLIKLADCFYAARIDRSPDLISNSDIRLQERIGRKIANLFAPDEMWSESDFESTTGTGICAELQISIKDQQGSIFVWLDENLVSTLTKQLKLQNTEPLYEPFCHSLTTTPVKLNVLLSKKELPLSDLISLQPNDVLPIELLSNVPVSIGDEHLFNGRVAEKEGQLVLIINQDKESLQ